jgi:hypothetical protein
MTTEDQELETRRFAIALLCVILGFVSVFIAVGAGLTMLLHWTPTTATTGRQPGDRDMTRTPLDLRDKTMTELTEMDREIGNKLDSLDAAAAKRESESYSRHAEESHALYFASLLADRYQVRAKMVKMNGV